MQRPPDGSQTVQGVNGALAAARDPHQSDHLARDFVEAHEVQGVLQDAAEAAMILRRSQNDPRRLLHLAAQPEDVLGEFMLVPLSIAKSEPVISEVDQSSPDARLLGALQRNPDRLAGITSGSDAPAD